MRGFPPRSFACADFRNTATKSDTANALNEVWATPASMFISTVGVAIEMSFSKRRSLASTPTWLAHVSSTSNVQLISR